MSQPSLEDMKNAWSRSVARPRPITLQLEMQLNRSPPEMTKGAFMVIF